MRELPGAGDAERSKLNKHPADDTTVRLLGLISELGFAFLQHISVSAFQSRPLLPMRSIVGRHARGESYTLENLLPLNIVKPCIKVLDSIADRLELILVGALDLVGLADDEIESQTNTAIGASS